MITARFGKSGDKIIDKFIFEKDLKWIPYDQFNNIEYLDEGGFATIYKAIWTNKNGSKEVAFKCLNKLNENNENLNELLNEWKYHRSCSNSYEIINLYGFTKNTTPLPAARPDVAIPNDAIPKDATPKVIVVMDCANKGNLRSNLKEIVKYNWKQKLHMLYRMISGLNEIHKQKLIHCDFHDGNILYHKNKEDENNEEDEENKVDKVYISDLGLCQSIKSIFKKGEIYGNLPFIAPENIRRKPYTPASDIYSFSMIMWEFTSGIPPFNDKAHDDQLSLSICKGERPEIIENTPQCYTDLMKKCWDKDPLKRPSSKKVLNIIEKWIILPHGKEINDIDEELKSNIMEFMNAPIGHNNLNTESHPHAYHLHNFTGENSDEIKVIVISENLDDYIKIRED
ncbi:unnamed protein product [Rhizophagus irregularis]|nr:unnamed protein product [Rhizophagus irregularis]